MYVWPLYRQRCNHGWWMVYVNRHFSTLIVYRCTSSVGNIKKKRGNIICLPKLTQRNHDGLLMMPPPKFSSISARLVMLGEYMVS